MLCQSLNAQAHLDFKGNLNLKRSFSNNNNPPDRETCNTHLLQIILFPTRPAYYTVLFSLNKKEEEADKLLYYHKTCVYGMYQFVVFWFCPDIGTFQEKTVEEL